VPASEPPPLAEAVAIPESVPCVEESPQEEIVYVAEEVPAEAEECTSAPAVSASDEREATETESDDAGWVLPVKKMPMPGTVQAAAIALFLVIVGELMGGYLNYSASPRAILIRFGVSFPVSVLLLIGILLGSRLAWLGCRLLVPLGGILQGLGIAVVVSLLLQLPAKPPPELNRALWFTLGILLAELASLVIVFLDMGRLSARRYFGVVCPACDSVRCRPEDFWFRVVHCRSCRHEWTAAQTAPMGRLEDHEEIPVGPPKAVVTARSRKRWAAQPRSHSRMWVGITAAVLGIGLMAGSGYLAVTRLLPSLQPEVDPSAWRDFSPPGANFKVSMPGIPKYSRLTQPGDPNRIEVHTHEIRLARPKFSFGVSYSDYPDWVIRQRPVEARLNGSRDGAVQGIHGKLRSESSLSLNRFPGRELEIDLPGKETAIMRIYAVNQRIFILGAAGPNLKLNSPDVKRFFDSFQLQPFSASPKQTARQFNALPQPNHPNPSPGTPNLPKPALPQPPEPPLPPYQPTPVQPVVIKPPSLSGDKVPVPLPGPVGAVAVGGGGRYLILHLPNLRRLTVFDANEAKVVKEIAVPEIQIFFAASMDKLIVALPKRRQLLRYSLATFQHEATAMLPVRYKCTGMALGSASNGPLLITSVDLPRASEQCFFDIATMKKVGITSRQATYPNIGPHVHLHAAANGSVFTAGNQSYVLKGSVLDAYQVPGSADLLPGPDGRTLYSSGQVFTAEGKALGPNVSGHGHGVWYVPALHGPFFASLNEAREGAGGKQYLVLKVHLVDGRRPLVTFPKLDALDGLVNWFSGVAQPLENHVFLIPDAQLLVVLPLAKDRLILQRFNLDQMLESTGVDYLFIGSQPPTQFRPGKALSYQLAVHSKKGGLRYKLESGPSGMTLSPTGLIGWDVPSKFEPTEVNVIVTVHDSAGQEVLHAFQLTNSEHVRSGR
jgi:hypothetical protein